MKKLFQRLDPGGTIVIFENNWFNPITRKIVNCCSYDRDAVIIRPSELREMLVDSGLPVRRSSYYLFIPPSLSVLLQLEPKLGWLLLGGQYWIKATSSV